MVRPAVVAGALVLLAGCGPDGRAVVSAATSLKPALGATGDARLSFAGSGELAAQIRQGVRPDVFAAADERLPAALFAEGLVHRPIAFATNELVLAVAVDGNVRSLADAARPGRGIAIGAPGVPVGAYTRSALDRLPAGLRRGLRRNVRSEEPDVGGVIGKLVQGAVDAGFVYRTDVRAARGRLRAIALPRAARPRVVYAAALVRGSEHAAAGRAFLASLVSGALQRRLRAAGFGAP